MYQKGVLSAQKPNRKPKPEREILISKKLFYKDSAPKGTLPIYILYFIQSELAFNFNYLIATS